MSPRQERLPLPYMGEGRGGDVQTSLSTGIQALKAQLYISQLNQEFSAQAYPYFSTHAYPYFKRFYQLRMTHPVPWTAGLIILFMRGNAAWTHEQPHLYTSIPSLA